MHSVALDEAHEMLINKDIKTAVVRPTKEYLDRILYYFPVRSQALKQLKREVFLDNSHDSYSTISLFDLTPSARQVEENIITIKSKLNETAILSSEPVDHGLKSLSGKHATPEQAKDLLNFWEIGQRHFETYVKYYILQQPSAQVPQRLNKLLTFATSKRCSKKMKLIDREKRLMNRCMRRKLAWNAKLGVVTHPSGEQYIELPRAICNPHGIPNKGQKSYATKWLENRYKGLVINNLPVGWIPESVVLEGMFMINVSPLASHHTMKEYTQFLLRRYALPHFVKGAKEVHIVFDNPGRQPLSPKSFERRRRDDTGTLPSDHHHAQFFDDSEIPPKWRDHLQCRECKRHLVEYLGKSFMQHAPHILRGSQKVVLAGCFTGDAEDQAWEVSANDVQPNPLLNCSAEEADTRVWFHVRQSCGTRKIVCSPDTDVFHIGLPLIGTQLDVYVQISTFTSPDTRLLHLNLLRSALAGDPDLAPAPANQLPKMLQTAFISTGCDYISFFSGLGKATFLRVLFQHSSFINANTTDYPGTLADTDTDHLHAGFLAFIRLVGTTYFKKHISAFKYETSRALMNSLQESTVNVVHQRWLDHIRDTVWEHIEFEDELPPSWEALWRHWLRSCWVSNLWGQASQNHYQILPLNDFGWKVSGDNLEIDWEDPQNVLNVQNRVKLLLKGCSCKKNSCINRRCGCVRGGKTCGPGCNCNNCENTNGLTTTTDEVEAAERQDDLTAREQCRSELVEDDEDDADDEDNSDDEDNTEDVQMEEDGEVYDDYDCVDCM